MFFYKNAVYSTFCVKKYFNHNILCYIMVIRLPLAPTLFHFLPKKAPRRWSGRLHYVFFFFISASTAAQLVSLGFR